MSFILLAYLILAAYRIHFPGLYYDEVIFVGPAAGMRPYDRWFGLPLLTFPYIGALKSWLYAPIFAIFGVSVVTIRFPVILLSCLTLWIGYFFVRRMLSRKWAAAFTVACAVHPGFVFLVKVDMGPIAIMLLLKALCLWLLFEWLEGPQTICWSLLAACLLGFLDKFNYIWFVVAMVIATPVVFRREIVRKLTSIPLKLLIAFGVVVISAGFVILWTVAPLLKMPDFSEFAVRFWQIWDLYVATMSGLATAQMWFRNIPRIPYWTGWAVLLFTAVCLLLTLVICLRNPEARRRLNTKAVQLSMWSCLMFAIIFLEIMLTPQAGGAHHGIMLFPFDLLACFSAAFALFSATGESRALSVLVLQEAVFLVWVFANVQSLEMHYRKFRKSDNFHARWNPDIELLAEFLNVRGDEVLHIYCVDWGIGNQLQILCRPRISHKIRDTWPTFDTWSAQKAGADKMAKWILSPEGQTLYVSFDDKDTVFLQATKNFRQMEKVAGDATVPIHLIPADLGKVYLVRSSAAKSGEGSEAESSP